MKKLFSISFAFLILISGLHLSVATHICGGKVTEVKWSFSQEKATCGMENTKQTNPVRKAISSDCCKDEIANYTVDNNYNPSVYQFKEVTKTFLQVFCIPVIFSLHSFESNSLYADVSPRDNLLTSAVSLVDICVFRI